MSVPNFYRNAIGNLLEFFNYFNIFLCLGKLAIFLRNLEDLFHVINTEGILFQLYEQIQLECHALKFP